MSVFQSTAFLNSAIFVGLAIAASLVGRWLAKALRAADYGWEFGIVVFAILAGAVVVYPRLAAEARNRPGRRNDPGLQGRRRENRRGGPTRWIRWSPPSAGASTRAGQWHLCEGPGRPTKWKSACHP